MFNWYYKCLELLRRYLVKYGLEMDLENLDFEAINKEMEVDKATQAIAMNDENPIDLEEEASRPN